MQDSMTVYELNRYASRLLQNDILLSMVDVSGEISNLKRHSSGHIYFTLKDSKARVSCSFFKQYNSRLDFELKEGLQVTVSGTVSVYERDGQFQIYIYKMKPAGDGEVLEALEKLKARLNEEGLFDNAHKKPIKKFPRKVAVITSPTGAAIRDIINVTSRRSPQCEIRVIPVQVQGDAAPMQISKAIAFVNSIFTDTDTIILARGGGSIEDLWAFNSEEVVRAVYNSNIPIITGVGHETDFTLCDFAADLRAPTPSAAAELVCAERDATLSKISAIIGKCQAHAFATVNDRKRRIEYTMSSAAMKSPYYSIDKTAQALDSLISSIHTTVERRLDSAKNRVAVVGGQIDMLSPLKILSRGYAIPFKGKAAVKSINDVEKGDTISLRVADGNINCTVDNTEQKCK